MRKDMKAALVKRMELKGKNMKILVVDDDTAIVEVIRDTVNWKKLGIDEVLTAWNARGAKEILLKQAVDIVISDIEMPGESGIDLLKWYRNQGYKGKFLLLTCHESFSYASRAVELHAAEYLLKPFNVDTMEMVLKQNIVSLQKEQARDQAAEYGKWLIANQKEMKLSFLDSVINGKIQSDEKILVQNLEIRKLDIDVHTPFRMVLSYITKTEQDEEQYGANLIRFMLENLHSEILCGQQENEWVLSYEQQNRYYIIAISKEQSEQILLEKCEKLIAETGKRFESALTCCISYPCRLIEFSETYRRLQKIQDKNVIFFETAFLEYKVESVDRQGLPVLNTDKIRGLLLKQDKKGILDYLKYEINVKICQHTMNEVQLKIMRSEFQQVIYAHLSNNGIQISRLFHGETTIQMTEQSERSVIDLIRWAGYLLDLVFEYENNMQKADTLIDRIQAFVKQHYRENIGRNEIGAEFHLVPEYVARVYKKKAGKTLKEYINDYRLEQAQKLLKDTEMRISDIALETGFDNISYFSTLFKKATGMSPNEYRKR